MRIVILAAPLLLTGGLLVRGAALAAAPTVDVKYTAPSGSTCPAISRFHAMKPGTGVKAQKLGELPPADHYKAVYRTVRGCEVPIIADFRPGSARR